ncbi:MAG: ribonuclease P protein component [Candidatus Nomurabacteria bacterium]|nr:ribonuclease P protein component [Candidatus Nomurabacteria bacterium]USN87324.1 MAG: ribonuclease P protein component [Candidatus Nomurabacteria bacterium]
MLKKTSRLNSASFNTLLAQGRRLHNMYSTVIYAPATSFACVVVVGKKIFKKAHDRNRLRRRVYAVISRLVADKKPTGAYIVLIKPNIKELTKNEVIEVIKKEVGRVIK